MEAKLRILYYVICRRENELTHTLMFMRPYTAHESKSSLLTMTVLNLIVKYSLIKGKVTAFNLKVALLDRTNITASSRKK